jgi:serine/threonine protein kinase
MPLLTTLEAMHAAGVIHRDVKLENIFLTDAGRPLLGGRAGASGLADRFHGAWPTQQHAPAELST